MSLGPEKIILILVVALIVFGPQRLPEIARQVGAMIRELRRMQDSVRGELEQVLHPDFTAPNADARTADLGAGDVASIEDTDHSALPPGSFGPDMSYSPDPRPASANGSANGHAGDYPTDDATDDGFAGPRTFS
jgi:sec-independent protein translocase protein TatB